MKNVEMVDKTMAHQAVGMQSMLCWDEGKVLH
jgi:hypothetical protein